MWIVPKQLHTLACALDTTALLSDCASLALISSRSLLWRSKPMRPAILLRRLKRGGWERALYGRTLSPFLSRCFVELWLEEFSQPDFLASLFQRPESEWPRKTRAIFTRSSQREFLLADPQLCFSKTSRGSSAPSAGTSPEPKTELRYCSMSLETWKAEVTAQRGEYSARLKSARPTNESGCSSSESGETWPTPAASDTEGSRSPAPGNPNKAQIGLPNAVRAAAPNWKTPHGFCGQEADGYGGGGEFAKQVRHVEANNWPTPRASENENRTTRNAPSHGNGHGKTLAGEVMTWATPRATDGENGGPNQRGSKGDQMLPSQVVSAWPTPAARDSKGANGPEHMTRERPHMDQLANAVVWGAGQPAPESHSTNGRHLGRSQLNPDWVEQLMGLPPGWTALTACACSATASCPPPPPAPGPCSTNEHETTYDLPTPTAPV